MILHRFPQRRLHLKTTLIAGVIIRCVEVLLSKAVPQRGGRRSRGEITFRYRVDSLSLLLPRDVTAWRGRNFPRLASGGFGAAIPRLYQNHTHRQLEKIAQCCD